MLVVVRPYQRKDFTSIVALCKDALKEPSSYKKYPFSLENLSRMAAIVEANPTLQCCFLAERCNRIVGIIGGHVTNHPFVDLRIAEDIVLYLRPEYRKITNAAALLVDAYERWAIQTANAKQVRLYETSMIEPEVVARFFTKLGYTKQGDIYSKGV